MRCLVRRGGEGERHNCSAVSGRRERCGGDRHRERGELTSQRSVGACVSGGRVCGREPTAAAARFLFLLVLVLVRLLLRMYPNPPGSHKRDGLKEQKKAKKAKYWLPAR